MITQVIINVDSKLKDRAMKKAKHEGIPLSAVLKSALKAFANDEVDIGLVPSFNAKTRKEIDQALSDIRKGKNLSPRFSTVAQMKKYLDN